MFGSGRLSCDDGVVWLRADWLLGLLRLLHAAGRRLGGPGTGGHRKKLRVEEKLTARLALRRIKDTPVNFCFSNFQFEKRCNFLHHLVVKLQTATN